LADLAASLLLSLTFLLQTLKATSLPAPLFTGRFSLPVLKSGNRFALADLAASLLLNLTPISRNLKRHVFVRTASHWNIFSSSFERRKPDLLWPI
jgi:hypothetical protein